MKETLSRNSRQKIRSTCEMTLNAEFIDYTRFKILMYAELNILPTTHNIFKIYTSFQKIIPNRAIFFVGRIYNRELRLRLLDEVFACLDQQELKHG